MVYEPEQRGTRPWERPLTPNGKWPLKSAVKMERERETVGAQATHVSDIPGCTAPWILEEVGAESESERGDAQTPGDAIVGAATGAGQRERYRGPGREEAYQQRVLNLEGSPRVYSTVDTEGFKFQSPRTLREARLSPRAEQWMQACNDELTSFDIHDMYEVVDRPPDVGVLPTLWMSTPKMDGDGVIYRLKARLVVNGDRQIFGVDVNEAAAPPPQLLRGGHFCPWLQLRIVRYTG